MSNFISVAIGVVFNHEGKILISLRPPHKPQGGFWEFPGGKIEADETAAQALKRELFEEIGITVISAKPLASYLFPQQALHASKTPIQQNRSLFLQAFQIQEFTGLAHGKEGQIIDWVFPQALKKLNLLPGNHLLVEKILK